MPPAGPRRSCSRTARPPCASSCCARSSARPSPPPYAHAREVVAALARDFALGIVSNNAMPGDHHARVLRRAGILQHVGCAVWSANFGRRKPDPAMILHVLDQLGVPRRARDLRRRQAAHGRGRRASRGRALGLHPQARRAVRVVALRPDFTISRPARAAAPAAPDRLAKRDDALDEVRAERARRRRSSRSASGRSRRSRTARSSVRNTPFSIAGSISSSSKPQNDSS